MNPSPIDSLDLTRRLLADRDGSDLVRLGGLLREEQARLRQNLDGGVAPATYRHDQAYLEALVAGETILEQVWQFIHSNPSEVKQCQD